jgi:hypothetical protein
VPAVKIEATPNGPYMVPVPSNFTTLTERSCYEGQDLALSLWCIDEETLLRWHSLQDWFSGSCSSCARIGPRELMRATARIESAQALSAEAKPPLGSGQSRL